MCTCSTQRNQYPFQTCDTELSMRRIPFSYPTAVDYSDLVGQLLKVGKLIPIRLPLRQYRAGTGDTERDGRFPSSVYCCIEALMDKGSLCGVVLIYKINCPPVSETVATKWPRMLSSCFDLLYNGPCALPQRPRPQLLVQTS